jgi:hypothetical protein
LALEPVVVDVPPGVVTVTTTVAALSAGSTAVMEVAEFTVTAVAAVDPNLTVDPLTNPVPMMVTLVPPAVEPPLGLREVTVGAP